MAMGQESADWDHSRGPVRKRWLPIVVWLGLGFGVIVLIACGAIGRFAFRSFETDIPAVRTSAESFLIQIKQDKLKAAYDATSPNFQKAQTFDQFSAFVNRYASFKTSVTHQLVNVRIHFGTRGKQGFSQWTLQSADNAMACTISLMENNGEWRVESLTVP